MMRARTFQRKTDPTVNLRHSIGRGKICRHYYGFFHYRRYMSFKQNFPVTNGKIQLKRWTPYLEADSLEGDLSPYDLDEMHMRHVIEQYDVITVLSEHMDVTAYEQFYRIGDLIGRLLTLKKISEK